MNLERLISSIVRQTTVLIARLSTAGGQRSPLARVADQVFVGLVEDRCHIPLGDDAGFEAALLDHHQAVLNALAAKIASGARGAAQADETGGSTFSFELWPGHPDEAAVRGLLAETRGELSTLWERVSAFNVQARSAARSTYNVTFYFGQWVREDGEETT